MIIQVKMLSNKSNDFKKLKRTKHVGQREDKSKNDFLLQTMKY